MCNTASICSDITWVYHEHPDIYISHTSFDSQDAKIEGKELKAFYCRIYKGFVNLHSIRQAIAFISPPCEADKEAQIHTLYRERKLCYENVLTTVQHSDISKQFKVSQDAMLDEKKFLD